MTRRLRAMTLEQLSDALPGELPVGRDCAADIESQNLALMMEYLVERANQKTRERGAEQPDQDPGEARNAAALRDEGKRRLVSLEGILKDLLKVSSVSGLCPHSFQILAILPDFWVTCARTLCCSGPAVSFST